MSSQGFPSLSEGLQDQPLPDDSGQNLGTLFTTSAQRASDMTALQNRQNVDISGNVGGGAVGNTLLRFLAGSRGAVGSFVRQTLAEQAQPMMIKLQDELVKATNAHDFDRADQVLTGMSNVANYAPQYLPLVQKFADRINATRTNLTGNVNVLNAVSDQIGTATPEALEQQKALKPLLQVAATTPQAEFYKMVQDRFPKVDITETTVTRRDPITGRVIIESRPLASDLKSMPQAVQDAIVSNVANPNKYIEMQNAINLGDKSKSYTGAEIQQFHTDSQAVQQAAGAFVAGREAAGRLPLVAGGFPTLTQQRALSLGQNIPQNIPSTGQQNIPSTGQSPLLPVPTTQPQTPIVQTPIVQTPLQTPLQTPTAGTGYGREVSPQTPNKFLGQLTTSELMQLIADQSKREQVDPKYNNPLGIQEDGKIKQFTTEADGFAAAAKLLRSPAYANLTVDQGMKKWSGFQPATGQLGGNATDIYQRTQAQTAGATEAARESARLQQQPQGLVGEQLHYLTWDTATDKPKEIPTATLTKEQAAQGNYLKVAEPQLVDFRNYTQNINKLESLYKELKDVSQDTLGINFDENKKRIFNQALAQGVPVPLLGQVGLGAGTLTSQQTELYAKLSNAAQSVEALLNPSGVKNPAIETVKSALTGVLTNRDLALSTLKGTIESARDAKLGLFKSQGIVPDNYQPKPLPDFRTFQQHGAAQGIEAGGQQTRELTNEPTIQDFVDAVKRIGSSLFGNEAEQKAQEETRKRREAEGKAMSDFLMRPFRRNKGPVNPNAVNTLKGLTE